jgi:diguanylate cyclase (GGDEF)-like protein
MAYSIVGIVAIFVHLIVNMDLFIKFKGRKPFSGQRYYVFFLLSVIAFHIADGFWGFLYDAKLFVPLYIDTTLFFVAMASSILLWGYFVYSYLGRKNKVILYIGFGVFILQLIFIAINFEFPILFTVDKETCEYAAQPARYAVLAIQIVMYLLLAVFSFATSFKNKDSMKLRYITVSFFSLFMIAAITLQVFFSLLPLYSLGYLLGVCALHSLVVEDEKAAQRHELEVAQYQIAYDPLTGAMSKHAYVDAEAEIDNHINNGDMEDFAVVVFDLNNLKDVNDLKGHEVGDQYIIESVRLIEECFRDVSVYRVGGDEFTLFLTGKNYKNRYELLENFNNRINQNYKNHSYLVVSAGMADYERSKDTTIIQIFTRADREMYARKHYLKDLK